MIPVIDCWNGIQNVAEEITAALKENGFVYLKNTTITPKDVNDALKTGDAFWLLPNEVKLKYKRATNYAECNSGYVGVGVEILNPKNPENRRTEIRESFQITPSDGDKMLAKFPTEVATFGPVMTSFIDKCCTVSLDILKAIGRGLHLKDPDCMAKAHLIREGRTATTLRLLRYPQVPADIREAAIIAKICAPDITHDDIGGLEVMNGQGVFEPVVPLTDAVLVNCGDLMKRWTSDRIQAVRHRVLVQADPEQRKRQRRSIAYFVHPNDDALIEPLDGSGRYSPVTARQHLMNMFAKTY